LVPTEGEQVVFCPIRLQTLTAPVKPDSESKHSQN